MDKSLVFVIIFARDVTRTQTIVAVATFDKPIIGGKLRLLRREARDKSGAVKLRISTAGHLKNFLTAA